MSSTQSNPSSTDSEFTRFLLFAFVKSFETHAFNVNFKYKNLDLQKYLKWVRSSEEETSQVITKRFEEKSEKRTKVLKISVFQSAGADGDKVLAEMGTQQVRQIARAALAIHTFGRRDGRILEMFNNVFETMNTSTGFLVGPTFFHMIIHSTSKRSRKNPLNMTTPSTFECLLYFHSVALLSSLLAGYRSNKLVTINYYTGTRIGFVCQTLYKAWARLAKSINISLLSALFSPYMSYDSPTSTFIPIPSREKGFSPLSQTESCQNNQLSIRSLLGLRKEYAIKEVKRVSKVSKSVDVLVVEIPTLLGWLSTLIL